MSLSQQISKLCRKEIPLEQDKHKNRNCEKYSEKRYFKKKQNIFSPEFRFYMREINARKPSLQQLQVVKTISTLYSSLFSEKVVYCSFQMKLFE